MISRLATKFEALALSAVRLKNKYPPLFIVGAPRSGTTLVYQYILNNFDFGYFPNVSKKHPKACILWAMWGKLRYGYEPGYQNTYGIIDGPFAPSDGWRIFQRWFPEYDYSSGVNEVRLFELKNVVRVFETIFQAPFANKNNSNSVRIEYLNKLFPDAFFVYVSRDPIEATLSLLDARKQQEIALDNWWGVAPPQFFDCDFSSEAERAVSQIWGVNSFIKESLARINPSRWIHVTYEQFCAEPEILLNWIDLHYVQSGIQLRKPQSVPQGSFHRSPRSMHSEDIEHLGNILHRLESRMS